MDAVKFLKEKERMCNRYQSLNCKGCPLEPAPEYGGYISCEQFAEEDPDEVVSNVEEWSENNPILTNAMKFEQIFGTLTPIAKLINESPKYWDMEYETPINVGEFKALNGTLIQ